MEEEGTLVRSIYYGRIGSEATERLLERFGHEGSFLLRDSDTAGSLVSVCENSEVSLQRFQTLQTLIESYRSGVASGVSAVAPLINPLDKTQIPSIGSWQEPAYMETCGGSRSSSGC